MPSPGRLPTVKVGGIHTLWPPRVRRPRRAVRETGRSSVASFRRFRYGSPSNDDASARRPAALAGRGAILAAACNGTGPTAYGAPAATATTTTSATNANAATIKGFSFQPGVLKVKLGSKVTWSNSDGVTHTVTADDTSFASGNLQPGGSFSFTFTRPGTFAYHCSIHSSMHGSVVVG
jgi:plastocyanin